MDKTSRITISAPTRSSAVTIASDRLPTMDRCCLSGKLVPAVPLIFEQSQPQSSQSVAPALSWGLAARGESPGVAPRPARRPDGKARRLRISGIFEGGATQPARGPQRGSRVGVERGCIAGRMQPDFHDGLLTALR